MSSMAKIFVVVNLVLGVAAFGAAATLLGAQNDYRAALEEQMQNYKDLNLPGFTRAEAIGNDI